MSRGGRHASNLTRGEMEEYPVAEQVLPEVIKLLEARPGLLWHHSGRIFQGSSGYPDLEIVGAGRVVYREVKPSRHTHLEPAQTTWKYGLLATGADFAVWGREDLADGTIERELDSLLMDTG